MFTQIPAGEYYLIETKAPSGYDENRTLIPVIVDNTGVYVNAGTANDGVSVRRGVGSIVHSMLQFAAGDDIDATLHDIKATLVTAGNGQAEGIRSEHGQSSRMRNGIFSSRKAPRY